MAATSCMNKEIIPLALPYAPDAFAPDISVQTMQIHHDTLYANYAKNYQAARTNILNATSDAMLGNALAALAFEGSGYTLHGLYFSCISPQRTTPGTTTRRMLAQSFGSLPLFLSIFTKTAQVTKGPGWVLLCWNSALSCLEIINVSKHQDNTVWQQMPLFALDLWEHAYYLDYKSDRNAYIKNWMKYIDWEIFEKRLIAATQAPDLVSIT